MIDPPPIPAFPRPRQPLPLWLLMGGVSSEHEISLSSALTALTQLESGRYRVRPVCILRNGAWCLGPEMMDAPATPDATDRLLAGFTSDPPRWPSHSTSEALAKLGEDRPALAVIIMHGTQGEDGRIQGLLEGVGLPYTGSGVVASALAMDKRHCQRLLRSVGIPVPPLLVVDWPRWKTDQASLEHEIHDAVGLPCVVKPSAGGSSVGIAIVDEGPDLARCIEAAFEHDPEVVICERFIDGTEVTCGVLEIPGESGPQPIALVPTEIVPRGGTFFDYHAKYTPGASDEITPARLSPSMTEEIRRLALEVHGAVGARGFSRTDFIVDRNGQPMVLETNTIPGLTPTSLLPQGAAACGIGFSQLLTILIEGARVMTQ